MRVTLQGGPHDGRVVDVGDHVWLHTVAPNKDPFGTYDINDQPTFHQHTYHADTGIYYSGRMPGERVAFDVDLFGPRMSRLLDRIDRTVTTITMTGQPD